MRAPSKIKVRAGLWVGLTAVALAACHESEEPVVVEERAVLQGTAAIGAPMAGARISVVDSDAATADPAPVTASADGRYTIDVSGLRAPLFVRAEATIDGEAVTHVSLLPVLDPRGSNTANVTPLTTAVAALVAPGGDTAALATPATLAAAATAGSVGNAAKLVANTLASDAALATLLGANFDPVSTPFAANGSGIDEALHRVSVSAAGGTVSIANLAAPAGDNGNAPAVSLTPAMAATPSQAPALPPSGASGSTPSAAEMKALAARIEACLAQPVSQRVTLDAGGQVTAVLGACNFVPPDWRSNGRSFAEEVGQFTFAKNQLTGAKFGSPTIVLAMAPHGLTDPKEVKHPVCNAGPCVVARFPLVTASGRPSAMDWVLGKINGAWDFVGNQRPYRAFVETRLNRKLNLNRDGAAPGSTADPYFFKDRYESVLRLTFDLSVGDTRDVRAVRFSGPGLPAAGVVLFRSQRCGTDDRMAITYQNGSTRVVGGAQNGLFQFWTGGSSAEFVLGAAQLDGTPLATPRPVTTASQIAFQDFTPVDFTDLSRTLPAWAVFKVEVFRYSALADEAAEVFYVRNGSGAENPASGPGLPWPTLDEAQARDRLTPTGARAGEIASFADALNWTVPAGSYVTSGYLFGQNLAQATNAQNETASYWLRGRVDMEVAAYGDSSATGWQMASPVAGTALSPSTQNNGTNPNPRCGAAVLPPLTTNTADYREIGLFTRGPDRQVRQAIWFWDN